MKKRTIGVIKAFAISGMIAAALLYLVPRRLSPVSSALKDRARGVTMAPPPRSMGLRPIPSNAFPAIGPDVTPMAQGQAFHLVPLPGPATASRADGR